MKQKEADALAKAIRNRTKMNNGDRVDMLHAINKVFREMDQFFNSKRFLDLGTPTLDENIHNDVSVQIHRDWWK